MTRATYISVFINAILAVIIFFLLRGCGAPCPEGVVIKHTIDTIRVKPDQVTAVTASYKPTIRKVIKAHTAAPDSFFHGAVVSGSGRSTPAAHFFCNDTVIQSDTLMQPDNYWLAFADTVAGNSIIGKGVQFKNLSPRIVETITKTITLKEKVSVYLGISAGFEASYKEKRVSNFNIGPEVIITEPHGVLLGYGYDVKNNGHRLLFAYKIKLRK
jgi:hypothetical protein